MHNLIFKYVLPPNVQPVGARRIHAPRRWQESGSEQEDGIAHRRQRRRLRAASVDDDTDEEWMGAKAAIERKAGKPPHTVPPIRHLSIGNQRQHSLMQQYASSPTVRTPGGSEIRRMSSKCGSLVSHAQLCQTGCSCDWWTKLSGILTLKIEALWTSLVTHVLH